MFDMNGVSVVYEGILYHYTWWNSEHSSFEDLIILFIGYFQHILCYLMECYVIVGNICLV